MPSRGVKIVDDPSIIENELSTAVNQNGDLRTALADAKEAIALQDETIQSLTEDRYALGTVISFQKTRLREPKEDELAPNDVVRIIGEDEIFGKVLRYNPDSAKYEIDLFDDGVVECWGNSSDAPEKGSQVLLWRPSVVRVAYENKVLELPVRPQNEYLAGQTVRIQMDNLQVCSLAKEDLIGEVVRVVKVLDEKTAEVSSSGTNFAVRIGEVAGEIGDGDEVVLDKSAQIILRKLGQAGDEYMFSGKTGIDWDSIGGLEKAKAELREAIELPHAHPKAYEWFKMKQTKGFLLYGPPGCGKTLLGKATATALSKIYTGNAEASGFILINGPEILQRYVGDSEAKIREIFSNARKFQEKNGYPAVIFIDEAEAVLRRRGSGISTDIENTIVPMFLTEMDGLIESGAIVLLATNRPDMLDPAVTRPGRVDGKIEVERPTLPEAEEIFRIHLKGVPISGSDLYALSMTGANELYNPKLVIYQVLTGAPSVTKKIDFHLSELASGALVANVCQRAQKLAFMRFVDTNVMEGVREQDIKDAVREIYEEELKLKHNEALDEFVADYREEVAAIRKVKFAR